jgi:HK97 family phage prohead protease/HK97 family phage major capsid protein
MDKNKILFLNSTFTKTLPSSDDQIDSIYIEGYASTNDVDRSGDVISASVWEKGLENYLKNPIILSQHDHDDPIGRMVEHKIDGKGLWVKARISAAAEVFSLVKDGVVTAFSVGFRILDAEYNAVAELFIIKEVELVEISVVSVPCNQNTLFSLSKSFNNDEEYKHFKSQFASSTTPKPVSRSKSIQPKEFSMNPEEIQQLVAEAAKAATQEAMKSVAAEAEKALAAKAAKEAEDAALEAKIKSAVANIQTGETGAEKLMADIEKRFEDQATSTKSVLAGLEEALREKSAEIKAMQDSKMNFADKGGNTSTYTEREKAVMLSKISGKAIESTKYGTLVIEKTGAHLPSATWELEVSLNMEAEIRRRLVLAPLFRNVQMKTNVMTMPINPEAGYGKWVNNSEFGAVPATLGAAGASAGNTAVHQLKEITLNAYKLATNEYMAYEEEEDSLITLLPIIRDAMIRRTARSLDKALALGVGAVNDPVKGLAQYAGVSATTGAVATPITIAKMRSLRKDLGALGLDPNEVTFVVNTDVYYDLLEDATFQSMNQVGTQATLLTGQIGQIGNSPVLVSSELPSKASGTNVAASGVFPINNIGAFAIYTPNFIVGNQRGLRMDTQELVETQRRVLVASLRTGFAQVATNLGSGVAALRYTA